MCFLRSSLRDINLDSPDPFAHNKKQPSRQTAMKPTGGFAVGLQLLLAASIVTSASADTDGIPEVGIGSLHPICDPLQEECISSDNQVQDEIIAALEAEDTVVGTSLSASIAIATNLPADARPFD